MCSNAQLIAHTTQTRSSAHLVAEVAVDDEALGHAQRVAQQRRLRRRRGGASWSPLCGCLQVEVSDIVIQLPAAGQRQPLLPLAPMCRLDPQPLRPPPPPRMPRTRRTWSGQRPTTASSMSRRRASSATPTACSHWPARHAVSTMRSTTATSRGSTSTPSSPPSTSRRRRSKYWSRQRAGRRLREGWGGVVSCARSHVLARWQTQASVGIRCGTVARPPASGRGQPSRAGASSTQPSKRLHCRASRPASRALPPSPCATHPRGCGRTPSPR